MTQLVAMNQKTENLMHLFKKVELTEIKEIVDKLAVGSKELSGDEIKSTLNIIDQWHKTTTKRADEKDQLARLFLAYFETDTIYFRTFMIDKVAFPLAVASDTEEAYEKWLRSEADLAELKSRKPQLAVPSLNTTKYDKMMYAKDHKLAETLYTKKVKEAERAIFRAADIWKKELRQTDIYNAIKTSAEELTKHYRGFTTKLNQLVKLAQLNVSVITPALRESIQKLIQQAEAV
jgi:hypothetical protein